MIALLSAAVVIAPAAAMSQPARPAAATGSVLDDWKIERQEDGVVLTPRDAWASSSSSPCSRTSTRAGFRCATGSARE
jgi:hypothetical protein